MGDFRASVKIEFDFMGKLSKTDMYINYDGGNNGVDRRVQEFFETAWEEGLANYRAEIAAAENKLQMEAERATYERLKAKFDPPDDRQAFLPFPEEPDELDDEEEEIAYR